MARDDPQINIRMPAKLKSRLEESAAENGRSVTAEIVARLEQSMIGPKHPPNIVVRLEALPYGSEAQEVSLGTFFENFSRTIKDSVAAVKRTHREARRAAQRSGDSLEPSLDADERDIEIAEQAAANSRIEARARNIREAENLVRRREERLAAQSDESTDESEEKDSPNK